MVSIIFLNWLNTILATPRQQLSKMGNGNGEGDGWWRWKLRWPTVTEMAMANGKGNNDGGCWQQCGRDGGSDGQRWPRQQWPTATVTKIGYVDVDGRDGNSNCNGDSHGKGNNDKGRVASSCAGNVQPCGRGNTLSPPPWTQRKVHSPALHHGGDTAKSVCSLSMGRVPDSSPWIVNFFYFTTTVQFTNILTAIDAREHQLFN